MTAASRITALYRYPVKGLSPEALEEVALKAGETFPWDRAYAIENGGGRFDPEHPKYLPKISFLMLMRDERLAALATEFDPATETLTISRAGRQVARGQLSTPLGRRLIEQFMAGYLKDSLRGAPKVVHAGGHSFSDVAAKCVHIVNLASVRELERAVGRPLHPLRFRANIYIDGLAPWEEFRWLDRDLASGDVRLAVFARTQRCEATNVDPVTAERNTAVPAALQRLLGHTDLGIYAKVTAGGLLMVGATLAPV